MATINLGSIKFNWRGDYAAGTAYSVDDVVNSSGTSYVCIAATTGNAPPNATYWNVMAQGGDVSTTLTTQGDILYRDASGLARLGAGTSGQVLQTGGTGANPSWVDASSGYVIQEKVNEYYGTVEQSITTTTPQWIGSLNSAFQTASSVTITPTSSSNKMEIYFQSPLGGSHYGAISLWRSIGGGSYTQLTGGSHWGNSTGDPYFLWTAKNWDEPNTTSAVTYRLYAHSHDGNAIGVNALGNKNSIGAGMILSVKEVDGSKLTVSS